MAVDRHKLGLGWDWLGKRGPEAKGYWLRLD